MVHDGIRSWIEDPAQMEDPKEAEEGAEVKNASQPMHEEEGRAARERRNRVRPKWLNDFVRMERG